MFIVVEKALGRFLHPPEEVHHVNEDKTDNSPGNLVACPDHAYHRLLHVRTSAYDACGNANWRRCSYCKKHDDPENMIVHCQNTNLPAMTHRECRSAHARAYAQSKKRGRA